MFKTFTLNSDDTASDIRPASLYAPFDTTVQQGFDFVATTTTRPTTTTPTPVTQSLYLTEKGDATAISVNDIHQGQIGDCYLLSQVGELAILQPSFFSNMIHTNANGTESVTLYTGANGAMPTWGTTAFKAITEVVVNTFSTTSVNNAASQDSVNGVKEIWPQVVEKAFAQLAGGYSSIQNGGSPVLAAEALTGKAATWMAPAALTLAQLTSFSAAKDMIVFDTQSQSGLSNGLISGHAYMFEGISGVGASATVNLGNPWGSNQATPVLFSSLAKNFSEVDIGHFA